MTLSSYIKKQCDEVRLALETTTLEQDYMQQLMDRHDEVLEMLIDIVNAPDRASLEYMIDKTKDYITKLNKKK